MYLCGNTENTQRHTQTHTHTHQVGAWRCWLTISSSFHCLHSFFFSFFFQCWQELTHTHTYITSLSPSLPLSSSSSCRHAHSASVHLLLLQRKPWPVSRLGWLPWKSFPLNMMVYPSPPSWNWDSNYTCICVCACMFSVKDLISLSCPRNGAGCLLVGNPGPKPETLLFLFRLLVNKSNICTFTFLRIFAIVYILPSFIAPWPESCLPLRAVECQSTFHLSSLCMRFCTHACSWAVNMSLLPPKQAADQAKHGLSAYLVLIPPKISGSALAEWHVEIFSRNGCDDVCCSFWDVLLL